MAGDCHVHMILDGVYYKDAIDAHRGGVVEATVRARLAAYRDAGIDFLRDGGDFLGVGRFAARIAPEYGIDYRSPVFPIYRKGRYGRFIGCEFSDLRDYVALVDEAQARGADFIKLMISGLMDFERFGVVTSRPLDAEEIAALTAIAHDRGFAVMAHANGAETVQAAIKAGIDSIEHGAYMDAETVEMLAQSKSVWVPTLSTIGNLIGDGRYPDAVLSRILEMQMQNLRRCAALGGRIALGSDAGAYRVGHVSGTETERALMARALGSGAEALTAQGEAQIRARFRRGA